MKYKKYDRCICGHIFEDHYVGPISKKDICSECSVLDKHFDVHTFKLDNLTYVEREAERRGL